MMIRGMQIAVLGALAALATVLAGGGAQAQASFFRPVANDNANAQLQLRGEMPTITQIRVSENNRAQSLDLTQTIADGSPLEVARVGERSNNPGGYTVTVSSENMANNNCAGTGNPCLVNIQNGGVFDRLEFRLFKDGQKQEFNTASNEATWTASNERTTRDGIVNPAQIAYDGGSVFLAGGTYEETLTFTISAN